MDLTELHKMADTDSLIDKTQPDIESLKIPSLHNKYLKLLQQESLTLKRLMTERDELVKERWLYYMGKADDAVYQKEPFDLKITRNDVDIFINGDAKVIKNKGKLEYQQEKVKFLEETIRSINSRNWNIRNFIAWKEFISGGK